MQAWISIRKQLYRSLEAHVRALLGTESVGTARYRQEYEKEFNQKWRASSREQLLCEMQTKSMIFMGDFHALQQSQKAQLRILKSVPSDRPLILAVEFFEARHQKEIDRFQKGALSEIDFLKMIQWQKNWGFSWESYRPLVRWAQKKKVRLIGLNQHFQSRAATTLKARDRFAAEVLKKLRHQYPGHRIMVIFGDLHLADRHLPGVLKKKAKNEKILSLFQNSEKIYFQLLEKGRELEVDVVRLSKDQFCLISVPPWVKWQNYLLFLEGHLDQGMSEGSEFGDEVENYLKIISHDLGVKIPEGSFSIHTPEDAGFWENVSEKFTGKELKWLQGWVERGASFYLPEMSAGFLARPSVNHAATLAMAVFHSHVSDWKKVPVKMPDEFLKLIWIEAVQYFGTKLINPKRKTDTIQDIKSSLAARLPSDAGKEALQLALMQKMNELLWLSGTRRKRTLFKPIRQTSYQEAARLLGWMLGEKLFMGYRRKILSGPALLNLIRRPVEVETFGHFYYEVLELIESLPDPFLSKTEKL